MATSLNNMKRNDINNSVNDMQKTKDVELVIQEIQQHVIDMDRHMKEFESKMETNVREYKVKITASMAKLTKMING